MMIEYIISDSTIQKFVETYGDYIVKDFEDRFLLKCVHPLHEDERRSAVLYKSSGVYACPVCGNLPLQSLLKGVETSPRVYSEYKSGYLPPSWDFAEHPKHFKRLPGDVLHWVNALESGEVIGNGWRMTGSKRRIYGMRGSPGFRLFAPVITESTTDAIRLLEAGIDAGSICSVSNWRKCGTNKIFVPQNDEIGIETAIKISHLVNTIIFRWSGAKDICDLSEEAFQKVIEPLQDNPQ